MSKEREPASGAASPGRFDENPEQNRNYSESRVIRPESMPTSEITPHKPTSQYRSAGHNLDSFRIADHWELAFPFLMCQFEKSTASTAWRVPATLLPNWRARMPPRIGELNELIELRLRADDNPILVDLYPYALQVPRPRHHEMAYNRERSGHGLGQQELRHGLESFPVMIGTISAQTAIDAFRGVTPLSRIYVCISLARDWASNARSLEKAYVLACFSELAYLHLSDNELPGRDRYKIFPSFLLRELVQNPPSLDLNVVTTTVGDFRADAFNSRNFVYVVFTTSQFVVIAVRGTVSLRDWGINLNALRSRGKRRGYHLGFLREAESAVGPLTERIEPGKRVYFTGHSLGGAVASILPYVFPKRYIRMTPYVFAAPRFANTVLATREAPYAYVRAEDIVPHLPPKFLGFGNTGFPPELIPPNDHWLSGIKALRGCLRRGNSITISHSMENYRHLLGKQIGEDFPPTVYLDALKNQL